MKKLLVLSAFSLLPGCASWNSLSPTQQAQIFCAVAADGTAIGVALTSGGAQATAAKVQGGSVVACNVATKVGQIVAASH